MGELLISQSIVPFSRWVTWSIIGVGLFLIARGIYAGIFQEVLIGATFIYASGYRKRIFISEDGLVRETRLWRRTRTTVLSWSEIKHVSLARRASKIIVFFEKDVTGWRVLFNDEDEPKLRVILQKYIPEVGISTIEENDSAVTVQ
jgi:hypothetical protein